MSISGKVLYRRSPHLVLYWQGGKLIFENYIDRSKITAAPITFEILRLFDRWRSDESLLRHLPEFSPSSVRKAIRALVRHSLLERSDRAGADSQRMPTWEPWNPYAGFFHFSTKDVQYSNDMRATYRRLRRRAKRDPMPSSIKRYPAARQFKLPAAATDSEFSQILLRRRTWREFSRRPIELAQLATLLGLTWGVQRWVKLPGLGSVALKTSPSGGALHPIEAYILALRVDGLPSGLYHYDADAHRLELLRRGASRGQLVDYLSGQWWFGPAGALILMTAVFVRTQWKYSSPRAYRVVLTEAGHLCQTFCLTASWLGLAPFCTLALADTRIEKDLGIDGVTESVLYAAGVGTRPGGKHWGPWPEAKLKIDLQHPSQFLQ
ncbi:MAG TPA: SagB family peptide dehydrogenase [Terriglobales bacterium]|nr:SagB family peptide dehydrogenase [Terriglobales bacterium]